MTEEYVSLADAILLGSAITEPKPYDINHCALGMAANAVGIEKDGEHGSRSDRFNGLARRWPWLYNVLPQNPKDTCWGFIAETFNYQVCPQAGSPTMTLEELCAKVRKMEARYVPQTFFPQPCPQSSTLPVDTTDAGINIASEEESAVLTLN